MNIFYLHHLPLLCAAYHVDRHVLKMIIEYCQLLCSAHWMTGSSAPYKLTHKNHPCAKWVRKCKGNYIWLCYLGLALCKEYTYRYKKIHKTQQHIEWLTKNIPNIPEGKFYQPPQAMPDEYKNKCSIVAYRNYYRGGKKHLHSYKRAKVPSWLYN